MPAQERQKEPDEIAGLKQQHGDQRQAQGVREGRIVHPRIDEDQDAIDECRRNQCRHAETKAEKNADGADDQEFQ